MKLTHKKVTHKHGGHAHEKVTRTASGENEQHTVPATSIHKRCGQTVGLVPSSSSFVAEMHLAQSLHRCGRNEELLLQQQQLSVAPCCVLMLGHVACVQSCRWRARCVFVCVISVCVWGVENGRVSRVSRALILCEIHQHT